MRKCTKCKKLLTILNFYKETNGRWKSWCKRCCNDYINNWRKKNPERFKHNNKVKQQRYRDKNPLKTHARNAIKKALREGQLHKTPCEICYKRKVEAHHSNYLEPLQVRWLCMKHHKELHLTICE